MKIAISGCGLRTPLLLHGLIHSDLPISRIDLYDVDPAAAAVMASLGRAIASRRPIEIQAAAGVEAAADRCAFFISSVRVGGMERRALDERLAVRFGYAGQETTGPAGFAMALRTVPVSLRQARIVSLVAPDAWIVNFTNPAGLITQAIAAYANPRVAGICDTPAELFWQISQALREPLEDIECDYIGLNHLGWVRAVRVRGHDVTDRLLAADDLLRRLYPAELFPPDQIRALELIPTEYLFFYYANRAALRNQLEAGSTRGEELLFLNQHIWRELIVETDKHDAEAALRVYRAYLNRRNASYMRLEAAGESALQREDPGWDPFQGASGYHRIAVETIRGLMTETRDDPIRLVLNVPNRHTIPELGSEDVIEAPCIVNRNGPVAMPIGPLPDRIRGLVLAVKAYERYAIEAARSAGAPLAKLALLLNPIVGEWQPASEFVDALIQSDPEHFGAFAAREGIEHELRV